MPALEWEEMGEVKCCIAGGGPAGMMLGYLLARAGIRVTVLEKHPDFLRDFRGDTVHPSTLELLYELGLLEEFLRLPHQEVTSLGVRFGNLVFQAANFRRVPGHCKFLVLMPQWDLLNFLSRKGRQFPEFEVRMQHEVLDVVLDGGRVTGVEVRTPGGEMRIEADLVVGCDGRRSTVRRAAGLKVIEFGVPIDVLWFRISRGPGDPEQLLGNINYGKALILLNRGDYFQAGLIIRKGSSEEMRQSGLERFRKSIREIAPYLGERVEELQDWEQIKLLTVQLNRLERWHRPGLLCIGDAAHAMSPAGGVGINLAIQDAVATANLLTPALREGSVDEALLARVQLRREFPARVTQFLQMNAHKTLARVFCEQGPMTAPWQLKAAALIPGLPHVLGRVVGIGVRPEHVRKTGSRSRLRRFCAKGIGVCAGLATALAVGGALALRGLARPTNE